jgi:hypothetical protein
MRGCSVMRSKKVRPPPTIGAYAGEESVRDAASLQFENIRHILEYLVSIDNSFFHSIVFRQGKFVLANVRSMEARVDLVHVRHAAMVAKPILLGDEQSRTCQRAADAAHRRSPAH